MAPILRFIPSVLLAFTHLYLLCAVTATPLLQHSVDTIHAKDHSPLPKRENSFTPVTGIKNYGVQPRLEIRELQQNADQWNIYLLGLSRWYATDQSDKLSYYQIAGIHGRPYVPWDDVQNPPGVDSPGYCAHVSNVFLTWHRPYLALYEQSLYQHIVAAVNDFPSGEQRQRYSTAAVQWRVPYWDWALQPPSGQSVLPDFMTMPKITVTLPNGTNSIDNPLYSYKFHDVSAQDFVYNPFATWNETKRYPTSWDANATSQNNLLGPMFDNNRKSMADRLFNLFLYYDNFTEFSTEAWMSQDVSNADSIESVHDVVHGMIGMNGHMTYLDYSAWDATFWLHHAMIDRCFALWQALNNGSYVEPMAARQQTFAYTADTVLTVDSPLKPFHSNAQGDFWTSDTVRSTRTFGYTFKDIGNGSPDAVRANIQRLYGDSRSVQSGNTQSRVAVSNVQTTNATATNMYMANVMTEKYAVNSTYAVYIFLGEISSDARSWPTTPNLVGTHVVFAALNLNGQIRDMGDDRPVMTSASIPLTSKILDALGEGQIANSEPTTVEDYLRKNLVYRVGRLDGTVIPNSQVPNVQVQAIQVDLAPQDDMTAQGPGGPKLRGTTLFKVTQ